MELRHTSTYKIMYDNGMSDIDIFEIQCDLYFCTEIFVTSHIGNIIKYAAEKQAKGEFDMDSFCKDTDNISELRSWLWECHDNEPTDSKSAELRHKVFLEELDNIVEEYCKKYGFNYDL